MEVIKTAREMLEWSEDARRQGLTVGCVPTMGYLHRGHVSLIEESARRTGRTVMTLFVNPTQFAPNEDLAKYPRDFDGDCEKASRAGAHAVFAPEAAEMYPPGYQSYVSVEGVSQGLEGEFRPSHFRGVATVVAKLFAATRPRLAFFGEKDFQQLKVIERMSADLNLGVEIVGMPTVREPDGLALSSRNVYLDADERERALSIYRALSAARESVAAGARAVRSLVERAQKTIADAGLAIDYVAVRDERTLAALETIEGRARMLVAAKAGKTRLIDNMALGEPKI